MGVGLASKSVVICYVTIENGYTIDCSEMVD